jgi:hypothetical protein
LTAAAAAALVLLGLKGEDAASQCEVERSIPKPGLRHAGTNPRSRASTRAWASTAESAEKMRTMDEPTVRAMLEQHFDYASSDPIRAHEMYHDDAVLEFPQSGERFVGADNFREWRSNYPASTTPEFQEIRGRDDLWVAELTISYDQGPQELRGQHP